MENLEKSWNLKKRPKSWKNHGISKFPYGKIMEIFLELHAHYPKKLCVVRTYSYDDNETGVCFIFCEEGVTKRGDVKATVRKIK